MTVQKQIHPFMYGTATCAPPVTELHTSKMQSQLRVIRAGNQQIEYTDAWIRGTRVSNSLH